MKLFSWMICLLTFQAWAQPDNSDIGHMRGKIPRRDFVLEQQLYAQMLEAQDQKHRLQLREAKFFIVNGETALARQSLKALTYIEQDNIKPILYRYLALIEFQDGQWEKALDYLNRREVNTTPHFAKICTLKTLVQIATIKTRDLRDLWSRCKGANSNELFNRDTLWIDSLVSLASGVPAKSVAQRMEKYSKLNLPNQELKSVLKLALFLKAEHLLIENLDKLDYNAIEDEELREIIAHIYFRQGRLNDAWKMMQDLSTPNVENMKGNLWLLRDKQELAYAQFKLALKQKANSHNAAERALPLAWHLRQWREGRLLAQRVFTHEKNRLQQLTTSAAFAVQLNSWSEAQHNLDYIQRISGDSTAHEVSQLATYVSLRQDNQLKLASHGRKTCEGGDLIACWLLASTLIWPELPRLLKQEQEFEPIVPNYKTLSTGTTTPFHDENFIDQRDIDELDDALIRIVKD